MRRQPHVLPQPRKQECTACKQGLTAHGLAAAASGLQLVEGRAWSGEMGAQQCNRQVSEGAHTHPQSAQVTIPAPFSGSPGPHLGVLAAHGQAPVVAQTAVVPATVSNARAHQQPKLWPHEHACTFSSSCCPCVQAASQAPCLLNKAVPTHHRPARLSPDLLQALQVIAQLGVQRGGGHLQANKQAEASR